MTEEAGGWLSPLQEAQALVLKGDHDAAVQKLMAVLNAEFFNYEALFMLGGIMVDKGQPGLAAVVTSAAIDARLGQKQEHFPEALINLGGCYKTQRDHETTLRIWQEALKYETIPVQRAKIMTNIAGLFVGEANPREAVRWCDQAIKEDPMGWGAHVNRGMAYLELGEWRKGWDGFAMTYNTGDRHKRQYNVAGSVIPSWQGDTQQKVIVFGDQGIGDEIYYANCMPDMLESCGGVILDCHPRLEHLFRRSFPQATVYGTRKNLSQLDWVRDCGAEAAIGLADLSGFFRNRTEDWSGKPYLRAEKRAAKIWSTGSEERAALSRRGSPLRVGLSWTGGTRKTQSELRTVPVEMLEPIVRARPDAHFLSLQYTQNAAREVCLLEERTGCRISHYPGWVECFDYDRTASFVSSLDLIVTVGTTIHHLGGALGVPTWTLVPSRPTWRYQLSGDTLPWYNSARVFRQEADGDWSHPIGRIAEQLAMFHVKHSEAAD